MLRAGQVLRARSWLSLLSAPLGPFRGTRQEIRLPATAMTSGNGTGSSHEYANASREELLARIAALEEQTRHQPSGSSGPAPQAASPSRRVRHREKASEVTSNGVEGRNKKDEPRPFDVSWYPCRKIALRFSYDGAAYSGLEIQSAAAAAAAIARGDQPVRTVEGELWRALCQAKLVDDAVGMQGTGWTRCGRTDRGVSAAGQVVSLWVRSKRVDEWPRRRAVTKLSAELRDSWKADKADENYNGEHDPSTEGDEGDAVPAPRIEQVRNALASISQITDDGIATRIPADPEAEEFPYVVALNRILPTDIRIQAWSPVPAGFSARFDCRYRHYKYFFSEGAPWVRRRSSGRALDQEPRLDIQAMRNAAQRFLGEHDFRNLCKIDGSKQITNYRRRIDGISIDFVDRRWTRRLDGRTYDELSAADSDGDDDNERMYVLNLRGTAFLYHQVRHIMAVLFLVGSGLEKASIVDELLNVEAGQTYRDRLLSARLSKLVLDEEGASVATHLPGSSATAIDDLSSLDVARAAHRQRAQDAARLADRHDDSALSEAQRAALLPLRDAYVFETRPIYEMASDRPLMLWECGFRSRDVQWRAGTYDGPVTGDGLAVVPPNANINSPTLRTRRELHRLWMQQTIAATMQKHMLLALPADSDDEALGIGSGTGILSASTRYTEACFPALESDSVASHALNGHRAPDSEEAKASAAFMRHGLAGPGGAVPLGNGCVKAQPSYKGLHLVKRNDPPEQRNAVWRQGKGQRRQKRNEERGVEHA